MNNVPGTMMRRGLPGFEKILKVWFFQKKLEESCYISRRKSCSEELTILKLACFSNFGLFSNIFFTGRSPNSLLPDVEAWSVAVERVVEIYGKAFPRVEISKLYFSAGFLASCFCADFVTTSCDLYIYILNS
jgi:hypothetical protein